MCMCVYAYINTHIYVCMYTYMYIFVYVHTCICMYVRIYIYTLSGDLGNQLYGVATICRLLKIIGLFCRILSLL